MSTVTIEQLNAYINQYEDDTTGLKQIYLDTAEQMIIDYIGYDFQDKDYVEYLNGVGKAYLQLSAFPVNTLQSVTINGVEEPLASFSANREKLIYLDGIFNEDDVVIVRHNAGNVTVPGIVSLVELQIAGLLFSESGGNIGVTSKSFDGGNSRTFVKTTNFDPYLTKLAPMKVVKWI
jgi:hypothetical protein